MNLRTVLLLDTVSTAIFALLCLGFTSMLVRLTGVPETVLAIAGWICVPAALLFAWQALTPSRSLLWLVVAGNVVWVLASIGVWITCFDQLTPFGHGVVIAQTLAVEFYALMEWRGLRVLGQPQTVA